jgi:hypothetical protein
MSFNNNNKRGFSKEDCSNRLVQYQDIFHGMQLRVTVVIESHRSLLFWLLTIPFISLKSNIIYT